MKLSKRLLKHPKTQSLLAWLLAQYIRFVYATSRKIFAYDEETQPYFAGEKNAIFAFWHGRLMMCPTINPPRQMHVLISHHVDGRLISGVISHFNQATISGSSSKGSLVAVKDMLRALKAGGNISITPDGPRGPSQTVAALGVVNVARMAKKPVLPITFSARHHKRFKSWDRFMFAWPFTTLVFCASAPIDVSRDADEEMLRLQIEAAMNEQVMKADALAGL